jgi:hypothetical protein
MSIGIVGLIWNLLTDLYDHAQLADNWAKVDYHDHSPGKGVQIPTEGIADAAITGDKLAAALDPTAAYATIKPILRAGGIATNSGPAAGTWVLSPSMGTLSSNATPWAASAHFYFDPAEWAAAGYSPVLKLRASLLNNSVAPATNYVFGVYPVSAFGGGSGANPNVTTLGTVLAGSTVTHTAPAASAFVTNTVEFAAPTAGSYVVGVAQSGTAAANSMPFFQATLGARQV